MRNLNILINKDVWKTWQMWKNKPHKRYRKHVFDHKTTADTWLVSLTISSVRAEICQYSSSLMRFRNPLVDLAAWWAPLCALTWVNYYEEKGKRNWSCWWWIWWEMGCGPTSLCMTESSRWASSLWGFLPILVRSPGSDNLDGRLDGAPRPQSTQ